jgi:hypothetical protein
MRINKQTLNQGWMKVSLWKGAIAAMYQDLDNQYLGADEVKISLQKPDDDRVQNCFCKGLTSNQ